jgi:RNA polymerase sigma factor (sigma-70 family)
VIFSTRVPPPNRPSEPNGRPEEASVSEAVGTDESGNGALDSSIPNGYVPSNWTNLVAQVQQGEHSGMVELYRVFSRGIRFYLCRQLGPQELDDRVHDTFLIVVQAIQRGELREPERLMGFVRTVVRRQVAAQIDKVVHHRREEMDLELGSRVPDKRYNPEQTVAFRQRIEMMEDILSALSRKDREILTRFYLNEESQEQICREMGLSETQFRLLKSRAKARLGELGKKRLQGRTLRSFFVRSSEAVSH